MNEITVPVLIVGGGGCGLSASNFLADLGVESLLIERHPGTAHLPKAHYINQRSMEIFRHHGLADAIYAEAAPAERMGKVHWYSSLGGDGPVDGVRFVTVDALGGGELAKEYELKGVTRPTNIPQIRLEPILRREAETRNPGRVLFSHELVSFTQDADGVDCVVRDVAADREFGVRAQYVLAADGGKTVGPALGVEMVGLTQMADIVGVHISADLSKYITEDDSVLRMIVHPDQDSSWGKHTGGILTYGPKHWDSHSEEWGITLGFDPDDPDRLDDDEAMAERVKQFLKVDVPITVHRVSHWYLESVIADRFQHGRIVLAGDAAHKHTPFAGLGLNSGIQDAHNLCWKLALVVHGRAPHALIATFETERRPVIQGNADWSLFAFDNHNILISSLGVSPGAPKEHNEAQFAQLLTNTPDGAARRARVQEVFRLSRVEYGVHDLEMGFNYASGAVVDDGSPAPERHPLGWVYTPTSRPGCRLPHAWLSAGGQTVSTHDLLPVGGFLLLTGEEGDGWLSASERLAGEIGLALKAVRIDRRDGAVTDPSGVWEELRGVSSGGALLVRPDGHVAWRMADPADDPYRALSSALDRILQQDRSDPAAPRQAAVVREPT